MKQKKKAGFSGAFALITAVLVLAVFVPINLIVSYYDKVFDMTPAKKYTLSDSMTQLLDQTSDKHIDVYFLYENYSLSAFQSEPNVLPLYHTLEELSKRDNITFTAFDPDKDADITQSLDPNGFLGAETGDIFIKCGDVVKKVDHHKIFQSDSDGIIQYAGEELIASAIKTCATGSLPTIYFLTGHGEKSLETNYSIYADQLKTNNYDVKEINLAETGEIPENTAIIYIAGPAKDISADELQMLSDYADNGGSLLIMASPCDTKGRFKNLEKLLEKFELGIDYNIVTESSNSNMLQDRDSKQSEYYFRVEYTPATDDFTEDLTTDINYLINQGDYVAGISNTRSIYEYSGDTAYIEKSPIIQSVANTSAGAETPSTVISTPMGGDKDTQKSAEELSNQTLCFGYYSYNKQTMGKLVLLGSTDMIDSEMLNIYLSGTQYLTLFTNTWLYDSDIEAGIGNKATSYDTMHFEDSEHATSVLRIFTVTPVIIALVGVAVWIKRRYA